MVIIDYGMGNVFSVQNALHALKTEVIISRDPAIIAQADHIILPGVGAFGEGMERLRAFKLLPVLEEEVIKNRKPFLGICLGMQFLATASEEYGVHEGLRWITGSVKRFERDEGVFRVPHIGWNEVQPRGENPLFREISNPVFYFVHSYHFIADDKSTVVAVCDYGGEFTAAVQRDNIFGVQFHPEKSQKSGLQLLKNFLNITKS